MNLIELRNEVLRTIESVQEDGHNPRDIEVSVQIERATNDPPLYSNDLDVLYDNYGDVSGCVIHG